MMGGAVKSKIIFIAPLLLALTACGEDRKSGGADLKVFCRVETPACWSVKDTDDSSRRAKSHNAIGAKLCGWTRKTHPCPKG